MNKSENLNLRGISAESFNLRGITAENAGVANTFSHIASSGSGSGSGSGCGCGCGSGSGSESGSGSGSGSEPTCNKVLKTANMTLTRDYDYYEIECPQEAEFLYIKFNSDTSEKYVLLTVNNGSQNYQSGANGSIGISLSASESRLFRLYNSHRNVSVNMYAACYSQCNVGSGFNGSGFNGSGSGSGLDIFS